MSEAKARVKINKLLERAGWRFFADKDGPANILLEAGTKIDSLGDDFQTTKNGRIDFLLLNEKGAPFIVLEAKKEAIDPLSAKEQARAYAIAKKCRFIILSNGNLHYFWDLERGNPTLITAFPTPKSVIGYQKAKPDPTKLQSESVNSDYIVLTQRPGYAAEAAYKNEAERQAFIEENKLNFLRPYQLNALHAIQKAAAKGKDRFLLEMATGTGKTLTSAAIIKLFLRTGNATRVLFLVDRLELEDQANKAFRAVLANDFTTSIYKETKDNWREAEIVVTTVQSLLFNNKYQSAFSPTDFDLVISDEAHRSIGGNARAVFNYFVGYKLGLTATPRHFLRNYDPEKSKSKDPHEIERRMLLDTYRTFGCDDGKPTFQYTLLDGVKDGFLINPTVVDARTTVTAQLLSKQGLVVDFTDAEGNDQAATFKQSQFEKEYFSEATNELFCKTFLENALRDPISGEIGKSIVFAVSQHHAAKLTQILNQMAFRMFRGKYQSDFAVQVTSHVEGAQQHTVNFTNNKLLGTANFLPTYKTSKARVCVTVGMMTTGYDCPDLLNLGLFRPIFSVTDFIQIKGRGTRRHDFRRDLFDEAMKEDVAKPLKSSFKLFDFFASCEFFEKDFKYDEVLKLPPTKKPVTNEERRDLGPTKPESYEHLGDDLIETMEVVEIGLEGMKVDRVFYEKFEDTVRQNSFIAQSIEQGHWDQVVDYLNKEIFNKPSEYYSLEKLRKAAGVDRKLGIREILEKIFGLIPRYKSKDELLEEEFSKFIADIQPTEAEAIPAIRNYFKAYATSDETRRILESGHLTDLATNPAFTTKDFKEVPPRYRTLIPQYVRDYVPLNQFAP